MHAVACLRSGGASCSGLGFGKCICHAEPTLDLDDGFDLLAKTPSSFYVNRWGDRSFMTLSR